MSFLHSIHRRLVSILWPAAVLASVLCAASVRAQATPEPAPAAPAKENDAPELSGAPGKGFTADFGDAFSLNVRSRAQIRYQLDAPDQGPAQQNVSIGTLRLWFSGNVLERNLQYMIQLAVGPRDYRDGAISPVYDAYLDWQAHRDLNLRVGQYFVPFDRLRTIREWALQMTDRPRPVAELTLDRDVGVTLYSDHFLGDRSPLAYRLGVFGGGGMNQAVGKDAGGLFVGRVELRPLGAIDDEIEGDQERSDRPRLALGAAVAANLNTNRQRSTTGATFSGGTTDYLHAATDLVFKWSGAALQAEYLWKDGGRDAIVSSDEDGNTVTEFTRSAHGWVLQASYLFDPPIELVGRLSRMTAHGGTDPKLQSELQRLGQEVGAGVNYYFNGHRFKLQAAWIARMPTDFDFGAADHAAHLQLDATF